MLYEMHLTVRPHVLLHTFASFNSWYQQPHIYSYSSASMCTASVNKHMHRLDTPPQEQNIIIHLCTNSAYAPLHPRISVCTMQWCTTSTTRITLYKSISTSPSTHHPLHIPSTHRHICTHIGIYVPTSAFIRAG